MLREQADISEHDLKSLERQGMIKAAKIGYGNWRLYTTAQVERIRELARQIRERREAKTNPSAPPKHLPAFRDQAVAYSLNEYNAVMEALANGTAHEQVPITTGIHPAVVKSIFKDRLEMSGGIFVDKPIVDAINALALPGLGTMSSAADLLRALKEIDANIDEAKKCMGVGPTKQGKKNACQEPRTHCLHCAKAYAASVIAKERAKLAKPPEPGPALGPDGLAVSVPINVPANAPRPTR